MLSKRRRNVPNFSVHVGALIIRTGFGDPLYYNYDKEPQNSIGNN